MPDYSDITGPANFIVFLLGLVSGSFVCEVADRLPRHENFVTGRSRCESCNKTLSWYELIPILSFCMQHGRCRGCGARLSLRYPLVEFVNGVLYFCVLVRFGFSAQTLLFCLASSALLGLSLVDWRIQEIPEGFNIFLLLLGLVRVFLDRQHWPLYVAGFFAVSLPLLLIFLLSKGKAIGGGDVKLMAAAGLLLGWKNILAAFVMACIAGSMIHILRMKLAGAPRVLALGPYLSGGIYLAALFGDSIVEAYLSLMGL